MQRNSFLNNLSRPRGLVSTVNIDDLPDLIDESSMEEKEKEHNQENAFLRSAFNSLQNNSIEFQDKVQFLEKMLICPISQKPIDEAVFSSLCGHVYSKQNLLSYHSSGNTRCPVENCTAELSIIPFPSLTKLIDLLIEEHHKLNSNEVNLINIFDNLNATVYQEIERLITCSITSKIFFNPATGQCGDTFEEEIILKRTMKYLPCCPHNISPESTINSNLFITFIQAITTYFPDLKQNHYFSLDSFISQITQWKTSLIPCLINYLIENPDGLNDQLFEHGHAQITPLTFLVESASGCRLLTIFAELREAISIIGLNKHSQVSDMVGTSVLYHFVKSEYSLDVLLMDPNLRNKITSKTLCDIDSGTGYSPIMALTTKEKGRDILIADAGLRAKITSKGLNQLRIVNPNRNFSALMGLTQNKRTMRILIDDRQLRQKIEPEALNSFLIEDYSIGHVSCPLMFIVQDQVFLQKLLIEDEETRNKITIKGLNHVIPSGPNQGISALFLLSQTANGLKGLELLASDKVLRDKILSETLETVLSNGPFRGVSALFMITMKKEGTCMLNDDEFRNKMTTSGMNLVCISPLLKGLSVVSNIIATGIELFSRHADLREKVSAEALSSISESTAGNLGLSAASVLFTQEPGRQLLRVDRSLRRKITADTLNRVVSQGDNANSTIVDQILNNAGMCEYLIIDDELANKINPAILHRHSQLFGLSPIAVILATDAGVRLFTQSAIIRSKITMQTLLTPFIGPQLTGMSGLYLLMNSIRCHPGFKLLLNENPELRASIGSFLPATAKVQLEKFDISFEPVIQATAQSSLRMGRP